MGKRVFVNIITDTTDKSLINDPVRRLPTYVRLATRRFAVPRLKFVILKFSQQLTITNSIPRETPTFFFFLFAIF